MYTGWKSFALTFALICVAGCCTANREIGRLASAVKDSPRHEEALRYASAIRGVILRIGNEGGERELDSALFRVFMASSFVCMFSSGSAADVRVYSLFESPDGGIICFEFVIDKGYKLKSCRLYEGGGGQKGQSRMPLT